MNVTGLKPRPGQRSMLDWTESTNVTQLLEPNDTDGRVMFEYDANVDTEDFVTHALLQEATLGSG